MWGHGFGCGDDTDGASDWLNAFISPRLPLVDVKYCAAAASDADGGVDGDSCQGKQWKRSTRPIVDVSVGVKHGARRVASHLASSLVLKPPLVSFQFPFWSQAHKRRFPLLGKLTSRKNPFANSDRVGEGTGPVHTPDGGIQFCQPKLRYYG